MPLGRLCPANRAKKPPAGLEAQEGPMQNVRPGSSKAGKEGCGCCPARPFAPQFAALYPKLLSTVSHMTRSGPGPLDPIIFS
jgi:hypothetical protein